ncbi:tryptophanyl-trna synthetase [Lasallia pustulata]|uniref:Tryptophan--tRNA ligase, cytoplasmic n=1 Tax=Lasallia pustulata TaxID=136370 RepID=A0A1W5CRV2_9LECA|nr:tryptophanyl-trna synthetase [Lasallia pustulata]
MATQEDEPGQPPALTSLSLAATAECITPKEQIITPFDVSGGTDEQGKLLAIDYDKIVGKFGATRIDKALLEKFERVTGQRPHRFLRRGIVFSHRELDTILDRYEKGLPFFLYTGRGPSSDSMHVGHAVPFEFTKWLQDVFDAPLVIMLTDDEKFLHSPKLKVEDVKRFTRQNAKDIIAVGFDLKKTFIFADFDYVKGALYENAIQIARRTTVSQIKGTFGFDDSNNIGEMVFPAIQSATAFATSFPHIFGSNKKKAASVPCLIPCAIDQDPYFRQCRDNAKQLGYIKPSLLHAVFLPALQGPGSKMSASVPDSGIFLNDTAKDIQKKVNKYAFSGGQDTVEKHRELGGRTKDDVPFQYLTFFMEDDEALEKIRADYEKGDLLTGELKKICIQELQSYVKGFQDRRTKVTDEVVDESMRERKLVFRGNFNPPEGDDEKRKRVKALKAELDKLEAEIKPSA